MKNPFKDAHACLVYRRKYLPGEYEKENQAKELYHWRTFGYYDSIYIDERPSGITYKDSFAIRYPSAFKGHSLLSKQVFTLIPFPKKDSDEEKKRRSVLHISKDEQKPFLGMIMIGINFVQDESGEREIEDWRKEYKDEPDYLLKLRYYHDQIKALLEKYIQVDKSALPAKHDLSSGCEFEIFLSTNCADICVIMRTERIEDIYLSAKLIRRNLSMTKPDNEGANLYCFTPQISTIVAMSTDLDEYNINDYFREINSGMAVDFRLSCNSREAEQNLLNCCGELIQDEFKGDKNGSILPGERVGGVLGVGEYSIYMSLLEFRSLVFNHQAFLIKEHEERSNLRNCLQWSNDKADFFNMKHFTISNVRLRFCNNYRLLSTNKEEEFRTEWLEKKHISQKPFIPISSSDWKDIESVLVKLRGELSLYRNRVHYSSYMVKESLSMINDIYYTYNDLLYEGNIHSYVLATQLFALYANVSAYLDLIWKEVKQRSKDSSFQRACTDAIDSLVEMINQSVLSINAYNKSLVAYSQLSLNYPNYEIQSKVNIEKYQVAYSAFVQSLFDAFPTKNRGQKRILAYVYLNLNEKDTLARYCFASAPFKNSNQEAQGDEELVSMLAIASPNYRRFAHMHHLLPQLCHEIGHHYRALDRKERNKIVYADMLSVVAKQVATDLIGLASPMGTVSHTDKITIMVTEQIQQVLLDEFYNKGGEGTYSYNLDTQPFSALLEPFDTYLFTYLNEEETSFDRFWRGYKELLAQASLVSKKEIRVCGKDLESCKDNKGIYKVNLAISLLNYKLVEQVKFPTGNANQADELKERIKLLELKKSDDATGWEKMLCSLLEEKEDIEVNVLMMLCMMLISGICYEYAKNYLTKQVIIAMKEAVNEKQVNRKKYEAYHKHYRKIIYVLSYFAEDNKRKQIPSTKEQMILLEVASIRSDKMQEAAMDLLKYAYDENREMYSHAEKYYRVSRGVKDALLTLKGMFADISGERFGVGTPTTANKLPFVMNDSKNRIKKIISNIQKELSAKGYASQAYLGDELVAWLMDSNKCRQGLENGFQQLRPKQCQSEAKNRYNLYNEVCADLAMCAAMDFTPFGYLAYTQHNFAERPDQYWDSDFTAQRIKVVTEILLEADNKQPGSKNEKAMHELEYLVRVFKENIVKEMEKLTKNADDAIEKLKDEKNSFGVDISVEIQEALKKKDQLSAHVRYVKQSDLIWSFEADAEESIWKLDGLAQEFRQIACIIDSLNDKAHIELEQITRTILDGITDVLAYLRTLKGISSAMEYLIGLNISESNEKTTFERRSSERNEAVSDEYSEEPSLLKRHYLKLWLALKNCDKNADNQWIQMCRDNETLISIAKHYNEYYNRPGKDRKDEFKEQIHFIMRYYWEGNLRYRCLRQERYDWNQKRGCADLQDWFNAWKNNE